MRLTIPEPKSQHGSTQRAVFGDQLVDIKTTPRAQQGMDLGSCFGCMLSNGDKTS